jgi:hypothetical protein
MDRPIEVAIGLGGTYLFLSIIVLALVEGVSGFLNRRGKNLQDALESMLTKGVATELIAHPLVQSLGKAGNNGKLKVPSYLGPTMFSQAMTDLIAKGHDAKTDIGKGYEVFLAGISDENARKQVQRIVGDKVESVEELQKKLEVWFNNSMDRLSGAYKRNTQWFSRGFAVALVFVLNVNTIEMTKMLWTNPEVRAAAVKKAQQIVDKCAATTKETQTRPNPPETLPNQPPPAQPTLPPGQPLPNVNGAPVGENGGSGTASDTGPETPPPVAATSNAGQAVECPDLIKETENQLPVPIAGRFWNGMASGVGFFTTLLGLLLSVWAVSLGAPFWFDTLRKLSGGIQQTGPKPERDQKK